MSVPSYQFTEVFPLQRRLRLRLPAELERAIAASSWSGISDKPSTFPPSNHAHPEYLLRSEFSFTEEMLEQAPPRTVLARLPGGTGRVDHVALLDLLNAFEKETQSGLFSDEDDAVLYDEDDVGFIDEDEILAAPFRPIVFFHTVADMLASESGSWGSAITLNWDGSDANMQSWTLVRNPDLTSNAVTLEMDDGGGFARTFSTKGPDAGDNFASVDEVSAAVAGARHTHHQAVAAFSWDVFHSLASKPAVTTTDLSGAEIIGDVSYVSNSHVVIAFGASTSGYAYLN